MANPEQFIPDNKSIEAQNESHEIASEEIEQAREIIEKQKQETDQKIHEIVDAMEKDELLKKFGVNESNSKLIATYEVLSSEWWHQKRSKALDTITEEVGIILDETAQGDFAIKGVYGRVLWDYTSGNNIEFSRSQMSNADEIRNAWTERKEKAIARAQEIVKSQGVE